MHREKNFPEFENEYIIPAGKPVSIFLQYYNATQYATTYCNEMMLTFTPEQGASYDAQVIIPIGKNICYPEIRKLNCSEDGSVTPEIIKTTPASERSR